MIISHLGRHEEAEALAAQAEQLAVGALGPEHQTTLWARHFVGLIAERRGDLDRAEALLRQVLASRERTLGNLDWATLNTLKDLAAVLRTRGRTDEARRLYVDAIDRYGRVFGLSHMQVNPHIHPLLDLLLAERDYAAIHDLWDRWLRDLLATPVDADPYRRYWRRVRLTTLIMPLVSLPEPTPFDAELVLRAAEEKIGLYGCSTDWAVLGAAHYRAGNLNEAIRALQISLQKPGWHEAEPLYWTVLTLVHARRGEWRAARECHETAMTRETTWMSTRQLRAEAAALLGVGKDAR
jgi:tetratricopeptide (TPR) repeat protein